MHDNRDSQASNVAPVASKKHLDSRSQDSSETQKELLEQVSLKEKELADMLEKTRQKAKEIIEEAKNESANLLKSGRTVTSTELDAFLKEGLQEVEEQVKQIKIMNDKKTKTLKKKARVRVEEVARQILKALLPVA